MPDLSSRMFKPLVLPPQRPLPTHPAPWRSIPFDDRITLERLEDIISRIPDGFLRPTEIDLLASIVFDRREAIAFCDNERGTFNRYFFPDYIIPTIEHEPWQQAPIQIPHAARERVHNILQSAFEAGKYEQACSSYRSRVFPVSKKNPGDLCLVHDLQPLNAITIRDAALPPRPDDFAESFVGRVIYGVMDLFSGYDARTLDVSSRDLTTFQCMDVSGRCTVLPQGATNAVSDFVRCTKHILASMIPNDADVFVDDAAVKGPEDDYANAPIPANPLIRRFVFDYAELLDRSFALMELAGVTASGTKLMIAVARARLVGSVADRHGWWLAHEVIAKVAKFPYPESVTEVRMFLGIAGVGRKWIRNFSLVAKPLTELCRHGEGPFLFSDSAREAVDSLKTAVTSAPVLKAIKYAAAMTIHPPLEIPSPGLMVVGVDSSFHGAGWVLYQYHDLQRHPALFGSCTFSAPESRYSQPKAELYGVFRALKELRHRVWGVHFLLEVDAKSLEQMIKEPDLPNAPMTRWVSYLQLFDFTLRHIPAEKGRAQDALSRRRPAPDDSDEFDGEAHLNEIFGRAASYTTGFRSSPSAYLLARGALLADMLTSHGSSWGRDLGPTPSLLHGSASITHDGLFTFGNDKYSAARPAASMLRSRSTAYFNNDRRVRSLCREGVHEFLVGDELVTLAFQDYYADCLDFRNEYHADPTTPPSHRGEGDSTIPDMPRIPQVKLTVPTVGPRGAALATLACIMAEPATPPSEPTPVPHIHTVRATEPDWSALAEFLRTGTLPLSVASDSSAIRSYRTFASRFFIAEDRLWRDRRDSTPQAVVADHARRGPLIAEIHDLTGHRGRDTTYTALRDRYWWPNMYLEVGWFVASCTTCQMHSRYRSCPPLTRSLCPSILRRVHVDTIFMPDGTFLMHASCTTSMWPEARWARKNNAKTWARFLYEDVICRFGCIPVLVCDNGSEFKAAARLLLIRHNIAVIVTSPYNAKANGIAERHGQTLCRALLKLCPPGRPHLWRKYLHAGLLAVRTTTSRATGYTPYYLLYGMHCLFPYDLTDHTWHTLDWDEVRSTEDLLSLRIAQLARREADVAQARTNLDASRQRAIEDFNVRNQHRIRASEFEPGTWVLLHETWLDAQQGHKGALRWSGPYVVALRYPNGSYRLRELDGTLMKSSAPADRLRLFYFRPDNQAPTTVFAYYMSLNDRYVTDIDENTLYERTCNQVSVKGAFDWSGSCFLDTLSDFTSEPGLERHAYRVCSTGRFDSNITDLRALQINLFSRTVSQNVTFLALIRWISGLIISYLELSVVIISYRCL